MAQRSISGYGWLVGVMLAVSALMANPATAETYRVTSQQFATFGDLDPDTTIIATGGGTFLFSDKVVPPGSVNFMGSSEDDAVEYDNRLVSINGGGGNNLLVVLAGTPVDLENTENQVPGGNCIVRNFSRVSYYQPQ